jgi:hypothetical protein
MNALKHMEVIFGVVVVVAGCAAAAMPDSFGEQAQPEAVHPAMPVVVVKGKRMTALEKRASSGTEAAAQRDGAAGS